MIAAELGQFDNCSILKSEVRLQDNAGKTALMHAIEKKKVSCALLLLEEEKDLKDNDGNDHVYYLRKYNLEEKLAKMTNLRPKPAQVAEVRSKNDAIVEMSDEIIGLVSLQYGKGVL